MKCAKYEIKKTKIKNIIDDDLDPSSSDNKTDSDTGNYINYEQWWI